MKKQFFSLIKACVCGMMLLAGAASCEKMNVEDAEEESKANVVLRIGSVEQVPFEMARTRGRDVNGVCSRLNFLVYQGGGKIKQINQTSDDEDFGEVHVQLSEGRYYLVVLAHSSDDNPSSNKVDEIKFTNAMGFTDTFFYGDSLIVGEDNIMLTLELDRITALIRFISEDEPAINNNRIRINYTGGSGALNGTNNGWGKVKSQQYKWFDVDNEINKYDLYTIPHEGADQHLKASIYYYEINGDNVKPLFDDPFVINNIPIKRNHVTVCKGKLFGSFKENKIKITINNDWSADSLYFDF